LKRETRAPAEERDTIKSHIASSIHAKSYAFTYTHVGVSNFFEFNLGNCQKIDRFVKNIYSKWNRKHLAST